MKFVILLVEVSFHICKHYQSSVLSRWLHVDTLMLHLWVVLTIVTKTIVSLLLFLFYSYFPQFSPTFYSAFSKFFLLFHQRRKHEKAKECFIPSQWRLAYLHMFYLVRQTLFFQICPFFLIMHFEYLSVLVRFYFVEVSSELSSSPFFPHPIDVYKLMSLYKNDYSFRTDFRVMMGVTFVWW